MTILALDIAGSCGYALFLPDGAVLSGVEDLTPNRFDGAGMRFIRLVHLLDKLHAAHRISILAFEEVRQHSSKNKFGQQRTNIRACQLYGGYIAHIMAWGEKNEVPYTSVPISSWKKALTGSGNAGKPEVKAHVERLGFSVTSQDEADAIGILLWCEEMLPVAKP